MRHSTRKPQLALIGERGLDEAAENLRALAHPKRLRMVQMLLAGKFSVNVLAAACQIPAHVASEHLRLMQRLGMLAPEKRGRQVFYTIADPHLPMLLACIDARFGVEKEILELSPDG